MKNIILIPHSYIIYYLEQAKSVFLCVDPDDVVFIAAALSIENSVIWSDDTHFQRQKIITVYTTKEMRHFFDNL